VEVLLENRHHSNFVTLLTSDGDSLFKWNNNFSWSYTGAVTDSMKERVKEAGGKVDGVLRFSIQWNEDGKNNIDFDAHCIQPHGDEICFSSYRKPNMSTTTGQLDVDIISPNEKVAVENITWSSLQKMKFGTYKFFVHNYSSQLSKGGFTAEIEFDGEIYEFEYGKNLRGNEKIYIAEVTLTKEGFTIKSLLDSKSSINSVEKWGLKTCKFHRASKIMLSPNYWSQQTGNKHYMFFLEGCQVEGEEPRPFFNEFLKEQFNENRKVFEILGSKIRIPASKYQNSGLGFSETQRNSVIVKVTGKFSRTLKVNF
jgi:hypothetical protein